MDSNQLFSYVYRKYGLRFQPIVANSTDTFVLKSPRDDSYFAMLSRLRIKQAGKEASAAVLDLKCGDFAATIRDIPGFTAPMRIKGADWVGVVLDRNRYTVVIKKALDYAFKLAMNETGVNVAQDQYFYIPAEKGQQKYQAQPIKPRSKRVDHTQERELVPDKIRQMLKIYDYSILPSQGKQKNFYLQGSLMADYEDNYDHFFAFKRFFPTYHDMSVGQLRTYFTWRTKLRHGDYQRTSTSYAYVYIYELLNNIGVKNPEDGYEKLVEFNKNYVAKFDPKMQSYLDYWLEDYVLYYDLGQDKIQQYLQAEIRADHDLEILHQPKKYSAQELAAVFEKQTSYWNTSKVIQTHQDLFAKILKCVWLELLNAKKYGLAYYSTFVAYPKTFKRLVFKSAVFYYKSKQPEVVKVDSIREYHYINSWWHVQTEQPNKRQRIYLNTLLHELDRVVRKKLKIGRPIKPRFIDQTVLKAIEQGFLVYQKQQKQLKIDRVKINFSNLKQIRANASETRDSLLTDEEKQLEQEEQKEEKSVAKPVAKASPTQNDYGLSKDEMFLLLALLNRQPWQAYIKQHRLMPSILADNINEKLLDEIGDNVIEFDENNQPQIIADYEADLKEIFE